MRQSIFFFLFLALVMTVMAAPSRPKSRCVPGGIKKKAGGAAKGAVPAKAAPPKAAPPKAAPAPAKRLGKRAGETSLCGIVIRGSSSSMCQGNPGYFMDEKTKVSAWTPWDSFKAKITSANVPSKYQCDHALELQLTVRALDGAAFCTAYNEMLTAWNKYDPKAKAADVMKTEFQRILKPAANAPSMLFYIDTKFNADKRAYVAAFLGGAKTVGNTQMKGYFAPKKSTIDGVATAIDRAASDLLENIAKKATTGWNYDDLTDEQNTLECALDNAQFTTYKSNGGPVTTMWGKLKALV